MFLILGKYSTFSAKRSAVLSFLRQYAPIFVFFILQKAHLRFCATNVTRYFKNTVSLARILNEILKFSILQVLYLYNYSIKVMKKITIAIDGFSSCGKSTMAKDLAREVGYIYIDSGAMYRAVTLYSIENGIFDGDVIDTERLKKEIKDIHISFRLNKETGRPDTYLNGVNVENKIRSMEVSSKVSPISTLDFVREAMVAQQQAMGNEKGIVMDGRDIIFVTATPEIRAQRRYDELKAKGQEASFDEILENVKQRDYIDQNREVSPLRKAEDALLLDNTDLSIEEQKKWLFEQFNKVSK